MKGSGRATQLYFKVDPAFN